MKTRKLALIHTVNWYDTVINTPFGKPFLEQNQGVQLINIMDDSLLAESIPNGGPTKSVIRRMQQYFVAAENTGANVIMSTCTTMGPATRIAREYVDIPVFNIDEPMAKKAVTLGTKLGIFATVPTSAPATKSLLELEAEKIGKDMDIKIVINQEAFKQRLAGNIERHDQIAIMELEKLQEEVDVIVLGQISLAQVQFNTNTPILQVGHSGFEHAGKLLSAN